MSSRAGGGRQPGWGAGWGSRPNSGRDRREDEWTDGCMDRSEVDAWVLERSGSWAEEGGGMGRGAGRGVRWEDTLWSKTADGFHPSPAIPWTQSKLLHLSVPQFLHDERGLLVATSCRWWLWQLKYLEHGTSDPSIEGLIS